MYFCVNFTIISERINFYFQDVIKDTLKLTATNSKIKILEEVSELVGVVLKVLTIESALRSAKYANIEGKSTVSLDNVESVLVQMVC